jgi:hypothetical protein
MPTIEKLTSEKGMAMLADEKLMRNSFFAVTMEIAEVYGTTESEFNALLKTRS